MNFMNKLAIVAAAFCLTVMVGCEKQEQFLKRNTYSLDFSYTTSSETFTIRSTGQWYISDAPGTTAWTGVYDWVSVDKQSGVGDGETYEQITVTCQANSSDARTATIYLQGCGESDVAITLNQADGLFEFSTPLTVTSTLKKGTASSSYIRIPYLKALGNESFDVQVVQTGGAGLSVENGTYYVTEDGSGNLDIPVNGTPTAQGAVTFDITVTNLGKTGATEENLGEASSVVRAGYDENGDDIYLVYQDFNGLPWGGDGVAMLSGVVPVDATLATLTIDAETTSCAYTENGHSSGVTSTIRTSNSQLFEDLGMTGWTGYSNYMRPGYIQLGTASTNTLGQPGSLVSPTFLIPEGVSDLLLTLRVGTWTTHHDQLEAGICTKHDGVYTWVNESNYTSRYINAVKCRAYADVSAIALNKWYDYSFVLPCSGLSTSSAFSIYITVPEACWNEDGSIDAGRIYVDDIQLVY